MQCVAGDGRPARSATVLGSNWKQTVSPVFSPTSSWASTRPVLCSVPRKKVHLLLPALAAPRLAVHGHSPRNPEPAGQQSASQPPTARPKGVAVDAHEQAAHRRLGRHQPPGQHRIGVQIDSFRTWGWRVREPLSDRCPAHAATARTAANACRTPQGSRGPGTPASRSGRPASSPGPTPGCSRSRSRADRVGECYVGRTVFQAAQGRREFLDLGNPCVSCFRGAHRSMSFFSVATPV